MNRYKEGKLGEGIVSSKKKSNKLCTIEAIKQLGESFIEVQIGL